jgi:hypothetical protein
MSRFYAEGQFEGKDVIFAYGYDAPLQEYFLSAETKDDRWDLVGTLAGVYGGHYNLYGALVDNGVWGKIPANHQFAIMGDLPF